MHVKRVEIDGFKSYASKVVIEDFDREFNAITGLNGSGKSNILDSICFVLGITNLSQIRASNFNDLIFKQGQAGITKATVTIVFDNRTGRKPLGYENCQEVIVRRQICIQGAAGAKSSSNQYQINGSHIPNNKVADLFRTVGLNVNNPHFLIMQGRITKVLNMKPLEILGMIEEAAGTKMYDVKRNKAIELIMKKDQRVKDINNMMEQDICPVIDRMKDDREEYLRFQRLERDISLYRRRFSAFSFMNAEAHAKVHAKNIAGFDTQKGKLDDEKTDIGNRLVKMKDRHAEMDRMKGNEHKKRKDEIDEIVNESSKVMTEAETAKDAVESSMEDHKAEVIRLTKCIETDKEEVKAKKDELTTKEGEIGGEEQKGLDVEEAVKAARAKMEALEQGMTTNESGEMVSLESQITDAKTRLTEITAEVKKREMRRKEIIKKRKEKQAELEKYENEDKKNTVWKEKITTEINELNKALTELNFDGDAYAAAETSIDLLHHDVLTCEAKHNALDHRIRRQEAQYRIPYPEFDKAQVMGSMVRLFRLKSIDDAPALEAILGNPGSSLVVRTQRIAKEMFKHNVFVRRTTIYPLDSMTLKQNNCFRRRLEAAKVVAARLNGNEQVDAAVDLITYHQDFDIIMRLIFGNCIICNNPDTAKEICFHKDVTTRTVSRKGGSDYKPSGIITGGSRGKASSSDLASVDEWFRVTDQLIEARQKEEDARKLVDDHRPTYMKYTRMTARLAELQEAMDAHREKNKFSTASTLQADIEAMDKELPEHEKYLTETADEMKELQQKINEFEERKRNEKAFADKEKAECKKKLKELEQRQKQVKGGFEKAKNTLNVLRSEVKGLEDALEKNAKALEEMKATVADEEKKLTVATKEYEETKAIHDEKLAIRKKFYAEIRAHTDAMESLADEIAKVQKEERDCKDAITALDKDREIEVAKEKGQLKVMESLNKKNTWISDEKEHFGQKGTDYDFENYVYENAKVELEEQEAELKKLAGNNNLKAMELLAPSEERVMGLQKKQQQLTQDREKLMATIQELDKKKKEELLKAFCAVNKDFGNIFSTLLPNAFAKLEPVHKNDPLEGVEIKVSFSGKWKDSLGELSGGQRSLVALSLVLAMLKFRPAPIYILDEVDAALDLSHTQNIGAMIKKHFKESQFIVVSLKEGMFNHANVLFKTRFQDGTSKVSRIDNRAANEEKDRERRK